MILLKKEDILSNFVSESRIKFGMKHDIEMKLFTDGERAPTVDEKAICLTLNELVKFFMRDSYLGMILIQLKLHIGVSLSNI